MEISTIPELYETFDKNGVKRYEETILFISESDPRIKNAIKNEFGQYFIRLDKIIKYNENGEMVWQLVYDDNGKFIQNQTGGKNVKELTISSENPLSKQLQELTGDFWNVYDFAMIDGKPLNDGKNKIFMHIATEMLFKIIN